MLEQQRPKKHYGRNIGIGCFVVALVVIVIIAIIATSASGGKSYNPLSAQATQAGADNATASAELTAVGNAPTTQATQAQATQAPTVALKWTTTQTFSGNGTKKTAIFTVPNDWKILWKCDPSSSFGGQYNVIVGVTGSDGSSIDPAAINTICKAGNTGDSTEEHQSGQVYLDIESEGSWTIVVQTLQ